MTSAGAQRFYSRPGGVAFRRIRDIPPCVVALAWWPEHTAKVADLVAIATGFSAIAEQLKAANRLAIVSIIRIGRTMNRQVRHCVGPIAVIRSIHSDRWSRRNVVFDVTSPGRCQHVPGRY